LLFERFVDRIGDAVPKSGDKRSVPAIQVKQWMKDWNKVGFSEAPEDHRRKPEPHFYIFSIPAVELRSLCGIHRRQTGQLLARAEDLGIQRQHDEERSEEISRFAEFGFPWSTLSETKRKSAEFDDLRKPGWLPTSIVINIIPPKDLRQGFEVDAADAVTVLNNDAGHFIQLPYKEWKSNWRPSALPPFEVIDGQHRLFAFSTDSDPNFELPVVAFNGLDLSWQAYLFWTINIKPKKINPSLAFDLYPLLRGEDWLDRAEGHPIYRETRAQELTEAMWSHPKSPWFDRINMLGDRQTGGVTQSAWIKSLIATFVRQWLPRRSKVGGLFGGRLGDDADVLGWSRAQQAAFLIFSWDAFKESVAAAKSDWAAHLRQIATAAGGAPKADAAFYGPYSLIGTDQGVRGFLHVVNDLCFVTATKWDLRSWRANAGAGAADEAAVTQALRSLSKQKVASWLSEIAVEMASFDWRSSSSPDLNADERRSKLVFRGSSGYKEIRAQLLEHIAQSKSDVGKAAALLLSAYS
jgi:DGQHR domain-containing protein